LLVDFPLSSEGFAVLLLSAGCAFPLSSEPLADLSFPSSVAASSVAPSSAPSAGTSPSAAVSSVFSGSTNIVGAATVAITKSLSQLLAKHFQAILLKIFLNFC